jgi:hypothetical protein
MKSAIIKRIVLDASVTAWCFEDESTRFTEGVLDLLAAGTEVLWARPTFENRSKDLVVAGV